MEKTGKKENVVLMCGVSSRLSSGRRMREDKKKEVKERVGEEDEKKCRPQTVGSK